MTSAYSLAPTASTTTTSDDAAVHAASGIRVALESRALWRAFNDVGTEMVVTKTGRKMFPKVEYRLEGLDPQQHYSLFISIQRLGSHRYKYVNGGWVQCSTSDPALDSDKRVQHHDGVLTGDAWMRSKVCFDRVKITNNTADCSPSSICLTSMCKYIPVLTIYKMDSPIQSAADKEGMRFVLPRMEFIAVTAYQNHAITQLKIAHNPFAKGFREGAYSNSSSSSCDRKRSHSPSSSSSSSEAQPSPKRSPILPSSTTSAFTASPTSTSVASSTFPTPPYPSTPIGPESLKTPPQSSFLPYGSAAPFMPLYPAYPYLNPFMLATLASSIQNGTLANLSAFLPVMPVLDKPEKTDTE